MRRNTVVILLALFAVAFQLTAGCEADKPVPRAITVCGSISFWRADGPCTFSFPGGQWWRDGMNFFAVSPGVDGAPATVVLPDGAKWGATVTLLGDPEASLAAIEELADSGVHHLEVRDLFPHDSDAWSEAAVSSLFKSISKLGSLESVAIKLFVSVDGSARRMVECLLALKHLKQLSLYLLGASKHISLEGLDQHPALSSLDLFSGTYSAKEIAGLSRLTQFSAKNCRFVEPDPEQHIGRMENLESLGFYPVAATGQPRQLNAESLLSLEKLRRLWLWNSKADNAETISLCTHLPLDTLHLLYADDELASSLATLAPSLKELSIKNTSELTDEGIRALGKLKALEALEVGGREYTEAFVHALSGFPLKHLRVWGRTISASEKTLASFANAMADLRTLEIRAKWKGHAVLLPYISRMKNLEVLWLDGIVEANSLPSLREIEDLRVLVISSESFDDPCAKVVASLPVHTLVVEDASCLTSDGYLSLLAHPSLRRLTLQSTLYLAAGAIVKPPHASNLSYVRLGSGSAPRESIESAFASAFPGLHVDMTEYSFEAEEVITTPAEGRFRYNVRSGEHLLNLHKVYVDGFPATGKRIPTLPEIMSGFHLRYLSNSSDGKTDDATRYVLLAIPLEYRSDLPAVYCDEAGRWWMSSLIEGKSIEALEKLTADEIGFDFEDGPRVSNEWVDFRLDEGR